MSDVSAPSTEYQRLEKLWCLPRTLMGGTKAMREAGIKYLPQEAAESPGAYQARLLRSTLFNAFRKTVKDMTGKVFRREVVLGDDVPDQIKQYAENIDLSGRHLNVFARDCFFDGMQTGIGYILTDMPKSVKRQDGKPATKADEQNAGIRPYLCYIKAEDLIGWKAETINGVLTLTQARIKEAYSEPNGEYAEVSIPQIRVLTPGAWEIWRQSNPKDGTTQWVKVDEGTTTLSGIPLAPIYLNRTGFMCGEPPLEDLADLNVAHWQSQSDQRNILHVARVPILFGAGFDGDANLAVGASTMIRTTDPNAKLEYVEHTGAAIDSGDNDLKNLEFQMQTQGLQLLVAQPGGKSATGEIHDNEKENSPLAMMANALGDAIEQSFGFMAEFMGLGQDAGGSVTVNTDFGISVQGQQDLPTLLDATKSKVISQRTFWSELRRRDVLSESFDADKEEQNIAEEATFIAPDNSAAADAVMPSP